MDPRTSGSTCDWAMIWGDEVPLYKEESVEIRRACHIDPSSVCLLETHLQPRTPIV